MVKNNLLEREMLWQLRVNLFYSEQWRSLAGSSEGGLKDGRIQFLPFFQKKKKKEKKLESVRIGKCQNKYFDDANPNVVIDILRLLNGLKIRRSTSFM